MNRARGVVAMALVLAVAAVVAFFIYRRLVAYPDPSLDTRDVALRFEDGALRGAGGALEMVGRVRVVTLEGSPAQVGAAHGRLLAADVKARLDRTRPAIAETVSDDGWLASHFHGARLRWHYRLVDDGIPGHQLVEMKGVAVGAGLGERYDALIRAHALFDVGAPVATSLGHDLRLIDRSLSLIAPAHDEAGDRLLVGYMMALPGLPGRPSEPTVFVVKGDGAIPFASVGSPGDIGVLCGVNREGLAVIVHPGHAADVSPSRRGQPAALLARELLEQARTLDEAVKILHDAEILGAAAFLLVDGAARRYTVVEKSPTRFFRDDQRPVVDGLFTSKPFRDDPENDRAARLRPAGERRGRASKLLRAKGDGGPLALLGIMRDRQLGGAHLPAGHRGTVDDPMAETVAILDPSSMVLWVGAGPGPSGAMHAIDLRFRLGITSEATAPQDLPEDSPGAAAAAQVIAARADLELALALGARGKHERASEAAERAVARDLNLPIARQIAGDLAERAGQHEQALFHYRAFLAFPDAPQARELVQAAVNGS